ncbi:uncharacterized protein LOC128093175 [Culex pipiens pallens]|uniref:uncharacterized protein LOC128093175 n=1 Tax=Culex pipiens pallens TaxID=42434 RepID=UPI0022AABFFF|nr:uncharacterized protein LOC128093175 [Culex pipiens pallens]
MLLSQFPPDNDEMDFFTLINLLLLNHRVAGEPQTGSCPKFEPIEAKPFCGRVTKWIPDNFGRSPFNTFDAWHFQPEFVVEMFVSSSESIALNVTLRCQQPDPLTGQLPPLSVWTEKSSQEQYDWNEKNIRLDRYGDYISLSGCKQLVHNVTGHGILEAESSFEKEQLNRKQKDVSCNFINEFVIARKNQTKVKKTLLYMKDLIPATERSNAKLIDFDLKSIVIEAFMIILLTMFRK